MPIKTLTQFRKEHFDSDFIAELDLEHKLARISKLAARIADRSDFSRRELAARMGSASTSTVQRVVQGAAYNSTLETLMRFSAACGYELCVFFVKKREEDALSADNQQLEEPLTTSGLKSWWSVNSNILEVPAAQRPAPHPKGFVMWFSAVLESPPAQESPEVSDVGDGADWLRPPPAVVYAQNQSRWARQQWN